MNGPAVIAMLGPTGVGKTAVAAELAGRLGIGIVSCDSMQVYRGFPVLTNQPSAEDRMNAEHELVGFVDPGSEFSAGEYAALARPLIERDLARSGAALVVGGTGLYMRAALAPLAVSPPADLKLRFNLEERAAAEGSAALHRELTERDPAAGAAIDPRNQRRVLRALEVVIRTGCAWSGRDDLWRPDYFHPTLMTALVLEREELCRRIDRRSRLMVEGGAVDEVRRFREERARVAARGAGSKEESGTTPEPGSGVTPGLAPVPGGFAGRAGITTAIGYAEIERYLGGFQSLDQTVERIASATRRYARRQLTWLRKVDGLVIIDVHDREPAQVAEEILGLVSSGEHVKEPRHP